MPDLISEEFAPEITRRVVLRGVAVGGVALPLLAACGSGAETADTPSTSAASSPEASAGGSPALASTADVPVGGGEILADEQIVLTQPTEGDFKAFTSVCTHKQCAVNEISDGVIKCPCHGSQYSIEDGSVLGGPAPAPLAAIEITVDGDKITRA